MIKEKYHLIMLFDFYGNLLTDNQKSILNLYCNYDLSLGEISERKDISRQAVYDTISRSEKKLKNFEKKLKLVEKFGIIRESMDKFSDLITKIEDQIHNESIEKDLTELKSVVNKIIKTY